MDFVKDDFVRLPPELGGTVGRVAEDSAQGKVRVRCPGEGIRIFRLDLCVLTKLEEGEDTRAAAARLNESSRKAAGKATQLSELINLFKTEFPDGFAGRKYEQYERGHKLRACEQMQALLGKDTLRSMIDAQQFEEIGKRALNMFSATSLASPFETIALKNGLKIEGAPAAFANALFASLYGEGEREARFTAFTLCLNGLRAAKWPIVTYFSFLAYPDREIFFKPDASKAVAQVCGIDLHYKVSPTWLTYSSLLTLAEHLVTALTAADLPPKDMLDVQSFISSSVQLDKKRYGASLPHVQ